MTVQDRFVIDSFAWFEYFLGSESGKRIVDHIERGGVLTPTVVVAELSEKYARIDLDFKEKLKFIGFRSTLVPLDERIAEYAGRLSVERKKKVKRWGMIDSVILATARLNKCRVVTGDEHFRDLRTEVLMIK
jgi:predicted nucleic acid-binding protein